MAPQLLLAASEALQAVAVWTNQMTGQKHCTCGLLTTHSELFLHSKHTHTHTCLISQVSTRLCIRFREEAKGKCLPTSALTSKALQLWFTKAIYQNSNTMIMDGKSTATFQDELCRDRYSFIQFWTDPVRGATTSQWIFFILSPLDLSDIPLSDRCTVCRLHKPKLEHKNHESAITTEQKSQVLRPVNINVSLSW